MKKILSLVFTTSLLFQVSTVFAWGTTGHRVVAEIAENNLSSKAKKELSKIIGKQKLAYWSNWPDFLKSDPTWSFADSWHYINMPAGLDRAAFDTELENSTDKNLYKRVLFIVEELKKKELTIEKKQEYLFYLIHLVGDAHQPLHIGRPEDLGGNKIKVEWFKKPTNLHSLWDSGLIDFEQYSYTEFASVLDIHGKNYNALIMSGNLADWIFDSYGTATKIYASVKEGEALSYKYNFNFKETIEDQLLKGGLRLAKILNEIYK